MARQEIEERYAVEFAKVDAQARALQHCWRDLVRPLPSPVRPGDLGPGLEVPTVTPHAGLAHYVAERGWPEWAAQIITASRRRRDEVRECAPIGVPVAP